MKGKGKMIGAICALAVFLLAVACPGVLAATSAEEKPTVVLTTYGGSIEDDSFISLCWQGLQNSQGGATLVAAENTPEQAAKDFLANCLTHEPALIWQTESAGKDAAQQGAQAHPDIHFAVMDVEFDEPAANLTGVSFRAGEGAFLAGYLAAHTTETGHLGFIGGSDLPVIWEFEYGFKAGALYGAQELGREIDFTVDYVGDFYNRTVGADLAAKQYAAGCDIIFQAAGVAGLGAIETAKAQNHYIIGVDSDQWQLAPEQMLTSVVKKIDEAIANLTDEFLAGKEIGGQNFIYGLKEGGVGLAPNHGLIANETYQKALALAEPISNGEISVPRDETAFQAFAATLNQATDTPKEAPRVAVIRNLVNDDHTQQFLAGCQKEGKARGFQVDTFLSYGDDTKMQSLVADAIAHDYDGLIISHGKASYSYDMLAPAVEKGIPIVTFDTVTEKDGVALQGITATSQDDKALARLSLDALLDTCSLRPARIVKVWYDQTLPPFARRNEVYQEYEEKGLIRTVAEIYPDDAGNLQGDTAKAISHLAEQLKNDEIDGIWAAWDELAKGVYSGLTQLGIEDVPLVSIDISNEDILSMQQNPTLWQATAAVDAGLIGQVNMQLLAEKMAGKTVPSTYQLPACLVPAASLSADTTMANLHEVVPGWASLPQDESPIFSDTTNHWAEDAIRYVSSHGLFQGNTEGLFQPEGEMTRAMLVTVLYRLAGEPPTDLAQFQDVPSGIWYEKALGWAATQKIVSGTGDGNFAPDAPISREEIAVILANYQKSLGKVVNDTNQTLPFADAAKISSWAKDAVGYGTKAGLLNGKEGNRFDPQGSATRAEVATILQRLLQMNQ